MVDFSRWCRHAFTPPWRWRMFFPKKALVDIEAAIRESEHHHCGEIRFVVENALSLSQVWKGISARQRAIELFSELRVWDTEKNSGVLVYVSVVDREVHIIADRGVAKCVQQADWDEVAQNMMREYRQGNFLPGTLQGIDRITKLLAANFPPTSNNIDELSNRPITIGRT